MMLFDRILEYLFGPLSANSKPFVPPTGPEYCRECGIPNDSKEAWWCNMRNPGCSDGR